MWLSASWPVSQASHSSLLFRTLWSVWVILHNYPPVLPFSHTPSHADLDCICPSAVITHLTPNLLAKRSGLRTRPAVPREAICKVPKPFLCCSLFYLNGIHSGFIDFIACHDSTVNTTITLWVYYYLYIGTVILIQVELSFPTATEQHPTGRISSTQSSFCEIYLELTPSTLYRTELQSCCCYRTTPLGSIYHPA